MSPIGQIEKKTQRHGIHAVTALHEVRRIRIPGRGDR